MLKRVILTNKISTSINKEKFISQKKSPSLPLATRYIHSIKLIESGEFYFIDSLQWNYNQSLSNWWYQINKLVYEERQE